ncbi:MAG: sigma-70 family RNA polymerase sigma factor [bacterium]|nr:sigma-70 family RNA polymerase sigma factor [bacterium]
MNTDELFIDIHKLPKPLPKQEVYDLLEKIKQGDERSREKLIKHNIRLVLYEVTACFKSVKYDKKDLVSIGNIGLMKAITTFDTSKKVEFATYAKRCIDNEILMFLRKIKKDQNVCSLNRIINHDKDGKELKIEDTISDKRDIVEEYEDNETYQIIRQIVEKLPNRDRKIIMLYFGFYNGKVHTQKEIADMMCISQPLVSKLITKILKRLAQQLKHKGVIELSIQRQSPKIKLEPNEKEGGKKMSKLQTIYEYFSSYTKEQVDAMLEKLTEEERMLITLRYGEDLNNPTPIKLSREQINKFYGVLIPKMRRLLSNPNVEIKPRKKRQNIIEEPIVESSMEGLHNSNTSNIENLEQKEQQEDDNKSITKEDCEKMLELLRTPSFNQIMKVLTVKESVIISLKLGYVDGKYFSTESIAEFLGIESQEVIDITKKVLLLYKENISKFIDNAIEIVTEQPRKLTRKTQ